MLDRREPLKVIRELSGVDVGSVYEVRENAPNDAQRFAYWLNVGAHPVAFVPADVLFECAAARRRHRGAT